MTAPIDLRERQYVSQYGMDILGLSVHIAGVPGDADGAVTVVLTNEADSSVVFTESATHPATGLYEIQLTSAQTANPGLYHLTWSYVIATVPQSYVGYIEIGYANPHYDDLDLGMKSLIDSVWVRFADCFDSPTGGPNLQVYFQSHWSRGRVSQLARIACGRLNTMAQPYMTYVIDPNGQFPLVQWGSLLESMTYAECIRHLIRSYTEQPELEGSSVTRVNRERYVDRWRQVLEDEEAILKGQLDTFKIRNMGFGRPRVLVSGGVYGRYGPTRFAGSVAARPRYWTRFY